MSKRVSAFRGECANRNALTLIEILVTISIVGVLIALLLPAVQAVREAGRRITCQNRLKQIGLAIQNYESSFREVPGYAGEIVHANPMRMLTRYENYTGIYIAAPEQRQGNWISKTLLFMEQNELGTAWGRINLSYTPVVSQADQDILRTPLPEFHCPSRRDGTPKPLVSTLYAAHFGDAATRTDYAMNGGSGKTTTANHGVVTHPGVWQLGKTTRMSSITDGLSNTYLAGEKSMDPKRYDTGTDEGDRAPAAGANVHNGSSSYVRLAMRPLIPDHQRQRRPQQQDCLSCHDFGSAHAEVWNVVMADGAVKPVSYSIDIELYRAQASIRGHEVIK